MARLLIVPGDNAVLRALPAELSGLDVLVLETANDALWEIRQSPPDIVVADMNLPGMSGLELAEIVPSFGADIRMVLWSREADGQLARQAESAGVHRFMSGAASADEVKGVVQEMLGATQPAAAPAPAASEPTPHAAEPARAGAPAPAPRPAAERSPREAQATAPAAPAAPPEPPRRQTPLRRREGAIVLTADNLPPIRNRMHELLQDVGSQCILLADRAGMVLAEVGVTSGVPTMILLPLLSTTFSTAGQISQVLRESDASALYVQEGTHFDLYCFDIQQRFMLVVIFDKAASSTKIGSVWVYAKRAIRDIQELLA
jgi:CheY-like chemotaxis protein